MNELESTTLDLPSTVSQSSSVPSENSTEMDSTMVEAESPQTATADFSSWNSPSAVLDKRHVSATGEPQDPLQRSLDYIRIFSVEDLDPYVELWLASAGHLEDVKNLVLKVAQHFPRALVRLAVRHGHEEGAPLLVWIHLPKDFGNVDEALDALDRFDYNWWLRQRADLRSKILVLLA